MSLRMIVAIFCLLLGAVLACQAAPDPADSITVHAFQVTEGDSTLDAGAQPVGIGFSFLLPERMKPLKAVLVLKDAASESTHRAKVAQAFFDGISTATPVLVPSVPATLVAFLVKVFHPVVIRALTWKSSLCLREFIDLPDGGWVALGPVVRTNGFSYCELRKLTVRDQAAGRTLTLRPGLRVPLHNPPKLTDLDALRSLLASSPGRSRPLSAGPDRTD